MRSDTIPRTAVNSAVIGDIWDGQMCLVVGVERI